MKKTVNQIDINYIFKIISENKLLFTITTLLFASIALLYASSLTKKYEANLKLYNSNTISLSQIKETFFPISTNKFENDLFLNKNYFIIDEEKMFEEFIVKLSSKTKFVKYLDEHTDFSKIFLNNDNKNDKKNLQSKYLEKNFFIRKEYLAGDKLELYILTFNYPENIKGYNILLDYYNKSLNQFLQLYISSNRKLLAKELNFLKIEKKNFLESETNIIKNEILETSNKIKLNLQKRKNDLNTQIYNLKLELKSSKSINLKDSILLNKDFIDSKN